MSYNFLKCHGKGETWIKLWMKASRITQEYENGVEEFVQFTKCNAESLHGKFFCSCVKCGNRRQQLVNDIRTHLICEGIISNNTKWIWHVELPDMPIISDAKPINIDMGHGIEDMIHNLGQHNFQQAHAPLYGKIQNDSKKHLYLGCTAFTRLSSVLALMNLKARFGC